MTKYPFVSVIVPIYNDSKLLHRTINSILFQTLSNIEIILVDDGSTDDSPLILKEYAEKDSRIRILTQKNAGGGAARNLGMEYAKGKYLSFLDADDWFYPSLLEELYNKAEEDNSEISFCLFEVPDPDKLGDTNFIKPSWGVTEKCIPLKPFSFFDIQHPFCSISSQVWNKLWLRSYISSNKIQFSETKICNDVVFVYKSLIKANRISFVNKILIKYFNNMPQNSKSKYNVYWREFVSNWQQIADYSNKNVRKEHQTAIKLKILMASVGWLLTAVTDNVEREEVFNYLHSEEFERMCISRSEFKKISSKKNFFGAWRKFQRLSEFKTGEYVLYQKALKQYPSTPRIIPIVLATDEAYAVPMSVTLVSMLENKHDDIFYDIYILVPAEFSKLTRAIVEERVKERYVCDISFIEVNASRFDNIRLHSKYLSKVTFYRFLIAEMLLAYDKVLYIDVDTVILGDLWELYNKPLKTNLLGAVRTSIYLFSPSKIWSDKLGMEDLSKYVNAGVLLMNLKAIRAENLTQRLFELASEEFRYNDQCILNKLAAGRVTFLEPKYNAMSPNLCKNAYTKRKLSCVYSKIEYEDMVTNPIIIHYISANKPWKDFNETYAFEWLKYAEKSPLFNEKYYPYYKVYSCYRYVKDTVAKINSSNDIDNKSNKSLANCHKLSLIIPVYNAEATIHQTLKSVLVNAEILNNCEIIIIDDGSTDNSLTIAKQYASKFANIKILSQNNEGSSSARNSGLSIANCEYVAFMNADDSYPDIYCLKTLYERAKSNDALICGGSWMELRKDKHLVSIFESFPEQGYKFNEEGFVNYHNYQFDFGYHRFIYNRQFLQINNIKFPPNRRYGDVVFFTKAMFIAKRFYAIVAPTYIYRTNKQSTIWNEDEIFDLISAIYNTLQFAKLNKLMNLYYITYIRYRDFKKIFLAFMMHNINTKKIFAALVKLTTSFDKEILKNYGINKDITSINQLIREYFPFISITTIINEIKRERGNENNPSKRFDIQ